MTDLAATHRRLADLGITRATLLVDPQRARTNIARFVARARDAGVRLRPHFKTHQSAPVAAWFAEAGITAATVSSLGQAGYFASHGWTDLTLAIGLNPRELGDVAALAARCRLAVTVDHPAQVAALAGAGITVGVWVEVDVGDGRAGLACDRVEELQTLVRAITSHDGLAFRGLLTHAGHTYGTSPGEAARIFASTVVTLTSLRHGLEAAGLPGGEISAGDTPGCAATADWSGLDEARPGNFVFYDLMQLAAGACTPDDLACAVACPVIGIYPQRRELVVHAGAVHLSKESLPTADGPIYGRLLTLNQDGFGPLAVQGVVTSLSQEHGVVSVGDAPAAELAAPGDLVLIAPVHSCLTGEQFSGYITPAGEHLARYSSLRSSSSRPDTSSLPASASRARGGSTKEV